MPNPTRTNNDLKNKGLGRCRGAGEKDCHSSEDKYPWKEREKEKRDKSSSGRTIDHRDRKRSMEDKPSEDWRSQSWNLQSNRSKYLNKNQFWWEICRCIHTGLEARSGPYEEAPGPYWDPPKCAKSPREPVKGTKGHIPEGKSKKKEQEKRGQEGAGETWRGDWVSKQKLRGLKDCSSL